MVIIDEIVDPSTVQLGFSEELQDYPIGHTSPLWNDWDGGQIGGKPSWLNPQHLPKEPLECRNCSTHLRFICQIYAPADHVNAHAFHRSFYVFACPACDFQTTPTVGSVRVLRTQLQQENPYYPTTEDASSTHDWTQHLSSTYNIELCQVCGQRGKGKCPVQKLSFCSRNHQKEYKQYACPNENKIFFPSVYTLSELVVDEEPSAEDGTEKEEREHETTLSDHNDPDMDLDQDDLDDATGKKYKTMQDPTTTDFGFRVKRAPDQCLRYYPQWGGEALWITSNPIPSEIPCCRYCGADRKCEFQIMPQMLYHLLEDHRHKFSPKQLDVSESIKHAISVAAAICETAPPQSVPPALKDCHDETLNKIQNNLFESSGDLDWGVIVVYTCTASCDTSDNLDPDLGAYREEYAWTQPPL